MSGEQGRLKGIGAAESAPEKGARHWSKDWWLFAPLLLVYPFALYSWSWNHPLLNWDDHEYILRNGWLLNFSWANVQGVFLHSYFVNYHPLTMLSYMVDVHLWGYSPAGFRGMNVLLHALTCLVAFAWLRRLGVEGWIAFFGVLLFSAHPLRVESVTWISERKDVLCGLFYVCGLYAWTASDDGRRGWLAMAIGSLILALLSKAMAVSLPLVWLAYEVVYRRRLDPARLGVIGFGVLLAGLFAWLNTTSQAEAIHANAPVGQRILQAAYSPLFYTRMTLIPVGIAPLYPMEYHPLHSTVKASAGVLFSLGALAIVILNWNRRRGVAYALLASAICLGPVSGIVSFGSAFAADRYTYIPTIILLAALVETKSLSLHWHRSAPLLTATAIVVLLVYTSLSIRAQSWWVSSDALWARVQQVFPSSSVAAVNRQHALDVVAGAPRGDELGGLGTVRAETSGAAGEQLDPLGTIALVVEATRLRRLGRLDEVEAIAHRLDDQAARGHLLRLVAEDRGDATAAVEAARLVADAVPPAPLSTRTQAALSLISHGQEDQGRRIMEKIAIPVIGADEAWGLLAWRTLQAGDADLARAYAERSLAISPSNFNALSVLIQTGAEKDPALERRLRRAVRHPLTKDSVRLLAWRELARRTGDSSLLELAYAIEHRDETDRVRRAKLLAFAGAQALEDQRREDALRLYGLALQNDAANVDALYGLALLRLQAGRLSQARNLLTAATKLEPEEPAIASLLERVRRIADSEGVNPPP